MQKAKHVTWCGVCVWVALNSKCLCGEDDEQTLMLACISGVSPRPLRFSVVARTGMLLLLALWPRTGTCNNNNVAMYEANTSRIKRSSAQVLRIVCAFIRSNSNSNS